MSCSRVTTTWWKHWPMIEILQHDSCCTISIIDQFLKHTSCTLFSALIEEKDSLSSIRAENNKHNVCCSLLWSKIKMCFFFGSMKIKKYHSCKKDGEMSWLEKKSPLFFIIQKISWWEYRNESLDKSRLSSDWFNIGSSVNTERTVWFGDGMKVLSTVFIEPLRG